MATSLRELLSGVTTLADVNSRSTPGFDGDKKDARDAMAQLGEELADLQERLWANGTRDDPRTVLLVLQGMDTSGKGGTIRHAAGLVDPQGLRITSFKKPTPEELEHDFLWRIEKALPPPGKIGIFDRSQYEDVLICRVRELAAAEEIERRYDAINDFEQAYVEAGGTMIKCLLHITADNQKERLTARLDDPTKHWKYNPGDVDERALWDDYQQAYDLALARCSTEPAPWFVVPSGRKWYRNWAVATLLLEHLRALGLTWPAADFDVDAEKARVAAS
ncbi:PPK2 family polyphosphate kinase [Aeromicrobium sp.]|uniref:PPK2 family polyphosphate kinase n=1 Tax=Aeromicrobium sp. TaxID=1871063 RepID=UPI003D6AC194